MVRKSKRPLSMFEVTTTNYTILIIYINIVLSQKEVDLTYLLLIFPSGSELLFVKFELSLFWTRFKLCTQLTLTHPESLKGVKSKVFLYDSVKSKLWTSKSNKTINHRFTAIKFGLDLCDLNISNYVIDWNNRPDRLRGN